MTAGRPVDLLMVGCVEFLTKADVDVETATTDSSSREAGVDPRYRYCVYGIVVVSDTPLALPEFAHGGLGLVECLTGPASVFLTARE